MAYLLFAFVVAVAPPVLHRPVVGQLSLALGLLLAQIVLAVWTVASHRHQAAAVDKRIDDLLSLVEDDRNPWRAP